MKHTTAAPDLKAPNIDDLNRTLATCRRAVGQGKTVVLVAPSIVLWLAQVAGKEAR